MQEETLQNIILNIGFISLPVFSYLAVKAPDTDFAIPLCELIGSVCWISTKVGDRYVTEQEELLLATLYAGTLLGGVTEAAIRSFRR